MASLILVAEDDTDIAETLRDILHDEGHAVHVARNGQEALDHAIADRPDLVLLDVGLPDLTGPEVALSMFLRDSGLERIPIVLVSAVRDLARIAAQVGTPYLLQKPFALDELLSLVQRALAERAAPKPPAV